MWFPFFAPTHSVSRPVLGCCTGPDLGQATVRFHCMNKHTDVVGAVIHLKRNDKQTVNNLYVYHTRNVHSLKWSVTYSTFMTLAHFTHIMQIKSTCPCSKQHQALVGRISYYTVHLVLVIMRQT